MMKRRLGRSDIEISPLVLGGNVFGWTADEPTSFKILDAFIERGFTAIDTADVYARWAPGNIGGESETILGKWMKARRNRDKVHIFTKVGSDIGQGKIDLSGAHIAAAIDASLKRLQTDYVDLYFAHWPDPTVSHEETLEALGKLIASGKVRTIGASNYDEKLLSDAQKAAASKHVPRYEVLQNEYNLYVRDKYEGGIQDFLVKSGLSCLTYSSLASGFLTGKYRSEADAKKSPRGSRAAGYLDEKGKRILNALDGIAARADASLGEISLAWIAAQPGVAAPIASATSVEQVESLARSATLSLSEEDVQSLTEAGR